MHNLNKVVEGWELGSTRLMREAGETIGKDVEHFGIVINAQGALHNDEELG